MPVVSGSLASCVDVTGLRVKLGHVVYVVKASVLVVLLCNPEVNSTRSVVFGCDIVKDGPLIKEPLIVPVVSVENDVKPADERVLTPEKEDFSLGTCTGSDWEGCSVSDVLSPGDSHV